MLGLYSSLLPALRSSALRNCPSWACPELTSETPFDNRGSPAVSPSGGSGEDAGGDDGEGVPPAGSGIGGGVQTGAEDTRAAPLSSEADAGGLSCRSSVSHSRTGSVDSLNHHGAVASQVKGVYVDMVFMWASADPGLNGSLAE